MYIWINEVSAFFVFLIFFVVFINPIFYHVVSEHVADPTGLMDDTVIIHDKICSLPIRTHEQWKTMHEEDWSIVLMIM